MAMSNINFVVQRHAVIWLLLAQLVALAPQLGILPAWIVLVWSFVAFWYWRIVTAAWSFPRGWIKTCLSLSTIAGVYFSFTSLFSLEAMVSILVLAVILKLLELKTPRDHWLI